MRAAPVRLIAVATVLIAPLLVFAKGYLPPDDALRHVAKAISGRPWTEILLLRPEITLDSNPGWHWILGAAHRWLGLGATDLLLFSVVVTFAVFSLGPLLLLRRPEAWLLALLLAIVTDYALPIRLMLGRPLLVAAAIGPLVWLLWPELEGPRRWRSWALFVACGAASCWIHGSYYLLALPVLALLVSGHGRAGAWLAAAFAGGIVLGAALTGQPLAHLRQMLEHGYLAMGLARPNAALVTEFQPFEGRPIAFAGFLALLAWRSWRRPEAAPPWKDPVVVQVAMAWALGFVALRFWYEWAMPALVTLAAIEFEHALEERTPPEAAGRLAVCGATALVLLLAIGSDLQGRWSDNRLGAFVSAQNETLRPWLPAPGGIAYSADMEVFFGLFFANPDARWRYVLGFEPAIMPAEDYAVYVAIKRSRGATDSYLPWLRKMRPEDRLFVRQASSTPPPVPGLEWSPVSAALWAGRLPANGQAVSGTATSPVVAP